MLSITMLAVQFGGPREYAAVSDEYFHLYRLRTAQCLLMGDIAKCLPYTIETLRFNATAELNRNDDNSRSLWIMTGVLVRAAVNMGYHRDPDHTPALATLQAEYRRRVWLSVESMDEVASFLSGLPRMLPAINSDTKEPRNIHDWELNEGVSELPMSRPLSDPTAATYMIVKGRVFHGLGEVIDFINGPDANNYTRVLEIDQLLRDQRAQVPSHMRVDLNQVDRSSLKIPTDYSTLHLVCMYHHGMCTLHRKFIRKDRSDASGNISRSRCIASSLALIDYQQLLQPAWYASSRNRQMLAPAAMTLLLELESRRTRPEVDSEFETGTLLSAFEKSVALWQEAPRSCEEAWKVCRILTNMLRSLKTTQPNQPSQLPLDMMDLEHSDSLLDMPDDKEIDWVSCHFSEIAHANIDRHGGTKSLRVPHYSMSISQFEISGRPRRSARPSRGSSPLL